MIEGWLEGSLIGWLFGAVANFVSSPGAWTGLGFAVALWFLCSLPFAITNILHTLLGLRNRDGSVAALPGRTPAWAELGSYRHLLLVAGLAVVIAVVPWGSLLRRLVASIASLDPSLDNPLSLAVFLAFLALLIGVALYWFLYESRARREVARFLRVNKSAIENHILMIDADGIALDIEPQYRWSYFLKLVPYFAPRKAREFEDDINKKLGAIPTDAKLLVFVHGGLNDYRPNLRRAYERYMEMKQHDPALHPVFVLWRSGLLPCYGDHVWNVRQGRQAARLFLRLWTVPATIIADFGRGFTRLFMTWYYQVITDMKPFTPLLNPDEYSWKRLYEELQRRQCANPASSVHITRGLHTRIQDRREYWRGLASYFNAWTFTVSFAVWPFIDAFGRSAWDVMLRRTRTLFRSPYEFDLYLVNRSSRLPLYLHTRRRLARALSSTLATRRRRGKSITTSNNPKSLGTRVLDAFERFLAKLAARPPTTMMIDKVDERFKGVGSKKQAEMLLDSPPTGALYEFVNMYRERHAERPLTLVGHSAGTIVLNRWLEFFPDLRYDNLVYMAAACSIRDCVSHVGPYLEVNESTQFYNLCLHPRAEQSERHAADFSPRGSLLEWIDSYFSVPLTHDDRTLGKWENILQATHLFPNKVRPQVHIKGFRFGKNSGGRFPEGNPQMHGEFSGEAFWDEDFWTPS